MSSITQTTEVLLRWKCVRQAVRRGFVCYWKYNILEVCRKVNEQMKHQYLTLHVQLPASNG